MPLPASVKVGGGQVFSFHRHGMEVLRRRCFSTTKTFIMWNTISKIDVEWQCLSGTLTILVSTGQRHVFPCSKATLLHVASVIHGFTKPGSNRGMRVDPQVARQMASHRRIGITDEGLMLKRSLGCCKAHFRFLPWRSLVSASLSPNRRTLTVSTHAEQAPEPQPAPAKEEDAKGSADGAGPAAAAECPRLALESIRIHGGAATTDALYGEITRMMGGRGSSEPVAPDIKYKAVTAQMTYAGVFIHRKAGCFGGVAKYFVPWGSLVCLSWDSSGLCSEQKLTVTDRIGSQVVLKGVKLKEYTSFRDTFVSMARETEAPAAGPGAAAGSKLPTVADARQHRKEYGSVPGLVMVREGVTVVREGCLSSHRRFVPWSKIDGLEMRVGCCGGSATLITEAGDQLLAGKVSLFSQDKLWKLYDKVQELKYGDRAGDRSGLVAFNRRKTARLQCEVTEHSIKLVAGSVVQEWDLERVIRCDPERGQALVLHLLISDIGHRRVLKVPVEQPDKVGELAKLITLRAARRRKQLENLSQA